MNARKLCTALAITAGGLALGVGATHADQPAPTHSVTHTCSLVKLELHNYPADARFEVRENGKVIVTNHPVNDDHFSYRTAGLASYRVTMTSSVGAFTTGIVELSNAELRQCAVGTSAPASLVVAPKPTAASSCRVTVGELQGGTINVHPPCELDVFMWNGKLRGESVGIRCANMGGTRLGSERFRGQTFPVCYDVDF